MVRASRCESFPPPKKSNSASFKKKGVLCERCEKKRNPTFFIKAVRYIGRLMGAILIGAALSLPVLLPTSLYVRTEEKRQALVSKPLFRDMRDASVRLFSLLPNNVSHCSGVVFKHTINETYVATARHCFTYSTRAVAVEKEGSIVFAKHLFIHKRADIAYVVVEGQVGRALPYSTNPFLGKLACSVSSPGFERDVIMCGIYYAKVCEDSRLCGGLFAPIFYGSSGGGVIEVESGKLVGILSAIGEIKSTDVELLLLSGERELPVLPNYVGATVIPIYLLEDRSSLEKVF